MASFTFDGPNKRIQVDAELGDSSFTAAEIYSAWKDWVLLGNAQFEAAFAESVGGNPLGGGSSLDTYVFLRNDTGWRIRPDARDHRLVVDGQLFGASDVLPVFAAPLSAAIVTIERAFSVRAVGVDTAGASPADVAAEVWAHTAAVALPGDAAAAVWAHASATTITAKLALVEKILRNKSVTNPATGQMTVYDDDGVSVLLVAPVYENVSGTQPYRGRGADRRDRLA